MSIQNKGGDPMSEKEKQILENIAKALPGLDEHQKNYLLGLGEGMVIMKEKREQKAVG